MLFFLIYAFVVVFLTAFNHNKLKTPDLSGMMCFISSPKQGFLYNVFGESELIARCMYTADVTSAVICNNMLYSITKHLIETYTIPLYATIAKYIKSRSLDGKDDGFTVQDMLDANDKVNNATKISYHGFPIYDYEMLQKV